MRPQELVKYGIEVRAMATDYDTPRKTDEELHEESLEELKAKRVDAQSGQIDVDEAEAKSVDPLVPSPQPLCSVVKTRWILIFLT